MKRFTFFLNIEGHGDDHKEAWQDAMERLIQGTANGEYTEAPEALYSGDEPIDAAELLNGPPYQEFGIDHGPEAWPGEFDGISSAAGDDYNPE